MRQFPIVAGLLRRIPLHRSALLLLVMLAARMTEGIGLLMVVPVVESLYAAGPGMADGAAGGSGSLPAALGGVLGPSPAILPMLLLFVALVALRALLMMAQQILALRYQNELVDRLRGQLFGQLIRAEWRWLSARRLSDHVALLTVGSNRMAVGINQLVLLVAQLAALLVYLLVALLLAWQIVLCAIVAGLVLLLSTGRYRRHVVQLGHRISDGQRAVQAELQDGLSSVRLVKIFGAEARLDARFRQALARLRSGQIAFAVSNGWGQLGLQTGGAVALAMLVYAGKMWFALPLSILLAIVLVVARLIPAFAAAQQSYHQWLHATPAIAEISAMLADSAAAAEPAADPWAERLPCETAVRIENVSLRHMGRDAPVLDNLSLVLPARTTTLLTGASGAGKSTIADLLMGLIIPDRGTIRVDGTPVSGAGTGNARQAWRASVAYVEQDAFLFHDSIRANLRFARPDASEEDLCAALRLASADFVFALPDGLDTVVGDRGARLSGGERQRLALARALLGSPSLLILDEATSALDDGAAVQVRQTIGQLSGRVTMLVIAHRTDGWDAVDQRLHLADGRVAPA
jgi:ATP-binding cassette, subfamily C, bacterial